MIVLDASAVLELLLQRDRAEEVERRILKARKICAPDLLGLEVAIVLHRLSSTGRLSPQRAADAFQDFRDLDITFYRDHHYLDKAWELRSDLTIPEGIYLALAKRLSIPLLTLDPRFAQKANPG